MRGLECFHHNEFKIITSQQKYLHQLTTRRLTSLDFWCSMQFRYRVVNAIGEFQHRVVISGQPRTRENEDPSGFLKHKTERALIMECLQIRVCRKYFANCHGDVWQYAAVLIDALGVAFALGFVMREM